MLRMLRLGLIFCLLAPTAMASDDDPFEDDEDSDSSDDSSTTKKADSDNKGGVDEDIPEPIDPDDLDDEPTVAPTPDSDDDIKFDDDEFDEDAQTAGRGVGQDDSRIYRDQVEKLKNMSADEELLAWERYLKKYPNSLFKSRIAARVEELNAALYDENLGASSEGGLLDAGQAELKFAQPLLLESIDPRNRVRAGLEFGVPSYINLYVDYEQQILRQLSAHGGIRRRYTGWSLEAGARYALIKSARTNMLLTGILDARLNLSPVVFPALRPVIGFGKRFDVMEGLDVQVQAGSDLSFYGGGFSPRYVGGANITLAPTEIVRAYIETSTYMKDLGDNINDDQHSSFRFNVISFGIRFVARKGKTTDLADIGLGATVPYTSNYWSYHYGSLSADINYYPQF